MSAVSKSWRTEPRLSDHPLCRATGPGLLAALLGTWFGLWIVVNASMFGNPVGVYPSLMAVITCVGVIQLLSIGLVGEYVGKTHFQTRRRPLYLLRDVVQNPAAAACTTSLPEHKFHAVSN